MLAPALGDPSGRSHGAACGNGEVGEPDQAAPPRADRGGQDGVGTAGIEAMGALLPGDDDNVADLVPGSRCVMGMTKAPSGSISATT